MPDQPKPPLKVDQSGCNFHRKLSLHQRINLSDWPYYDILDISPSDWSGPLEGHIRNFSSGVGGGP